MLMVVPCDSSKPYTILIDKKRAGKEMKIAVETNKIFGFVVNQPNGACSDTLNKASMLVIKLRDFTYF